MDKKNKLMKCIGAILAAAVVTAVGGIASWYIPAGNMNDFEYSIVTLLFQGIVTAIGYILILVLLGRKDVLKLGNGKSFLTGAIVGFPMLGYTLFSLIQTVVIITKEHYKPNASPLFFVLYIVAIICNAGIGEELAHRGIIINFIRDVTGYKSRKGLIISMIVSSVIFGFGHLTNLFFYNDFVGVSGQCIFATGIGFYLAALYARSKNIWFNIILHVLWDLPSVLSELLDGTNHSVSELYDSNTTYILLSTIIEAIVFTLLGLFLIRKKKMPELTE